MRHKLLAAAILTTIAAFAPVISVLLAWALTALFRCPVGYGHAEACLVLGLDITPALVRLGLFGWWIVASWLLLIPAAILWAVWLTRWIMRSVRADKAS